MNSIGQYDIIKKDFTGFIHSGGASVFKINKVFEHIYVFEEPEVNSFLVIGQNQAVMIDTGCGAIDFNSEIRRITELPVFLINTHGDYDHCGGNDYFKKRYINHGDLELIRTERPDDNGEYLPLNSGDIFDLGGVELEIIACPGHTDGSIMIYDRTNYIMFTADSACMDPLWMFGKTRNKELFVDSMEKIIKRGLKINKFLPSHGPYPLDNCEQLMAETVEAVKLDLSGSTDFTVCDLDTGDREIKVKKYEYKKAEVYTQEI